MVSSSVSSCVTSFRLAPVTQIDSGTPRASTRRCRLLPFFSPVRRVAADGLLSKRRLQHGAIDALPSPGNALHLVVLREPGSPQGQEEPLLQPCPEIPVHRAGTPKSFLRQRLPLAPGAQHIDDRFEDPPRVHRLAASSGLASVGASLRAHGTRWNQRLNPCPEDIRDLPGSCSAHRQPPGVNLG